MATEEEYVKFFEAADTDKDGCLSVDELKQVLLKRGHTATQAEKMFRSVDASGDKLISKEEFLAAMGFLTVPERKEARMRQLFAEFDKDGDGCIEKEEMKKIFKEMSRTLTDFEAQRMIEFMDTGGDNKVQYEEFIKYMFGV